ncbi:MAG: hypothetical protein DME06_08650 [Candidatus Rokuibacteriota bacterium]|nr:MAG: hypothetical protein DME06_08650 [Candidatus Rokubacteria bacterium]
MSGGGPRGLGPTGPRVVRLNRRVIYLVGAILVGALVAGLLALHAQGPRASDDPAERRAAREPASHPWFEGVPDQEPVRAPAVLDPLPVRSSAVPSPRLLAAPSGEESEAERRKRVLRRAMSAPIGVAAFERGRVDTAARRSGAEAAAPTSPADRGRVPSTPGAVPAAGGLPPEYLRASVRGPVSPYEVKAGTIIPAVMLGAINSELAGQILGQVRENVYNSDSGEYLLIPQGTRLVGLYDHHIVSGQERVLVTWKRLLLPNGSSLSLGDGMPGTDALGAQGLHDEVNSHYLRIFGGALLLSVISAGVQLSQIPEFGQDFRGPTAGNVLGAAVGQQLGSTSAEFLRRGISVAPTLEVRPGYPFTVMVTQDVIFPGPYRDAGLD